MTSPIAELIAAAEAAAVAQWEHQQQPPPPPFQPDPELIADGGGR